jgi:hypothetical protein
MVNIAISATLRVIVSEDCLCFHNDVFLCGLCFKLPSVATIKTLSGFLMAVNTFFIFFFQIVLCGHKAPELALMAALLVLPLALPVKRF